MRRAVFSALVLALAAASALAGSLFVLELKGGARVFALDRPMQKGRIVVFHRNPDGIYTSIPADEVVKIAPAGSADRTTKIAPGELLVLGGDIEGRALQGEPSPAAPAPTGPAYFDQSDYGYGVYWGYGWGSGRPPRPPAPPRPVPTNIGPNGYPIIAPPGSPGSTPPPIGPNGFPIIAPPPQREPR